MNDLLTIKHLTQNYTFFPSKTNSGSHGFPISVKYLKKT